LSISSGRLLPRHVRSTVVRHRFAQTPRRKRRTIIRHKTHISWLDLLEDGSSRHSGQKGHENKGLQPPGQAKEITAQACSTVLGMPLWEICCSPVKASPFHAEAARPLFPAHVFDVNLTDSNWMISSSNCHISSIEWHRDSPSCSSAPLRPLRLEVYFNITVTWELSSTVLSASVFMLQIISVKRQQRFVLGAIARLRTVFCALRTSCAL
jgi:hypothetical protein